MRTSTIRSAAVGAAVGLGFIAVGSARADDNPSNACAVTTTAEAGEPAAAAAAPTTVAAAATTAAAAPTTAVAAPTTGPAPTTAAGAAPTTAAGAVPTTVAGAAPTTVAAGAATTVAAPAADPGAALGPGATVQQFQAALVPVVGPTTDLAAEVVPLGLDPPTGVPTPEGTSIEDISVYYYPNAEDPARSYYDATMRFTASVPAADMITLYQTELTAAGYVQTADSVENEDGRQERWLTYDIPDSAYDNAELIVAIVDGDTDFVQIEFRHALDPAVVAIFSAWPTGLPLFDQATELYDASLRINNYGSDYEGSVRTSWTLPIPFADAHAQLLAALPTSPYTIDPDFEADENTVYLVGGEFLTLTVSTNEGYPEDTSSFSASATFDIQL